MDFGPKSIVSVSEGAKKKIENKKIGGKKKS
jgi:hypothetical protein